MRRVPPQVSILDRESAIQKHIQRTFECTQMEAAIKDILERSPRDGINQAAPRALIRPRIVSGRAYLHEAIETLH